MLLNLPKIEHSTASSINGKSLCGLVWAIQAAGAVVEKSNWRTRFKEKSGRYLKAYLGK